MANAEATLRLKVLIESGGSLAPLVSEAQAVGREISAALSGSTGGVSSGAGGGDFFSGLRSTVQLTRGELESFFTTTATTFGKVMGQDIPQATQMSTGDLQRFYSRVTDMNTELPKATDHLKAMNDMLALQNLHQAFVELEQFGDKINEVLGQGVKQAMSFEESNVDISNALRINKDLSVNWSDSAQAAQQLSDRLKSLGDNALDVALKTKFNDAEMLSMIALLAQNGIAYQDIVGGVTEQTAMLAQATNSDWRPAALGMVNVFHAMGSTLKDEFGGNVNAAMQAVADAMTNVNQTTGASLGQMQDTFKYVLPVSDAFSWKLQDVATAVAALYRVGIQGSNAGTALRTMLVSLTGRSAEAKDLIMQLSHQLGYTSNMFVDAKGNIKSFAEVQRLLNESIGQLAPAQQAAAVNTIFGRYAMASMMEVVGTAPKDFAELADKIGQTGTAAKKSADWANTTAGQWDIFKENVSSAERMIGTQLLDGIKKFLTEAGNPLMSWVTNLPQPTQKVVAESLAVAGGLAKVVGAVGAGVTGLALFNVGLAAAGTSLGAVALSVAPVVAAIAGVAAVVAALYLAWQTDFGGIRETTYAVWNAVKPTIVDAMTTVGNTVAAGVAEVKRWWDEIGPSVKAVFDGIVAVIAYFSPVWTAFWETIKGVVSAAWEILTGVIKGAWEIVSGVFDFFIHLLTGNWSALWDDLKRVFTGFKDVFVSLFSGLWDATKAVFTGFYDAFTGMFGRMWDSIKANAASWGESFRATLSSIWEGIKAAFKIFVQLFTGDWSGALDTFEQTTGMKKGTILAKVQEIIQGIRDFFVNLPGEALDWGKNLIGMFVDGIKSAVARVKNAVSEVAGVVKDFLGFHSPTKLGPASDSDEWMPNMLRMFTETMSTSRPKFQAAIGGLAMDMQLGVTGGGSTYASGAPYYGGGRGNSVSIVVNVNGSMNKGDVEHLAQTLKREVGYVIG